MNDINQAVKDIECEYKRLGDERMNNPACYCHDIFATREWNDLEKPVYAWQWNFSKDEYDGIKTLLTKYSNEIPEIIQKSSVCCKLMQLYISEWYKREYNGNDSNSTFKSIGIENYSTLSEKICRKLDIKVFKSRNVDGKEVGQNEWLYTIYVDGGLPLTYLSDTSKANELKNTIYEIISEKDSDNTLEFIGDDLDDLCGNGVINQSYRAHQEDKDASIYDFIQEFMLTENLKIEGFDDFQDIIRDAKQRVKDNSEKKFEVRVRVFKAGKYRIEMPQLFLRPEPNGNNYAISQERLDAWGVDPQSEPFELRIKCGDKKLWEEYYEKCLDGSYITRSRRITYDLPNDKESLSLLTKSWKLFYKQKDEEKDKEIIGAVENKMAEQGYLQMYNGDFYTWSSKSSNSYNKSAILYDQNVVIISDERIHAEESVSECQYGWVEFDESIQFDIEGKTLTKYCKAGQLIVECNNKHSLSKYHNGLDVMGQKLTLINVGVMPEFKVEITQKTFGGLISEDISKNIELKYHKGTNGGFQPLNAQSINAVGYYELQLTYSKTQKSTTIHCFALDKDAREHHVLGAAPRTDFQNFGAVNISYEGTNLNNHKKYWTGLIKYVNPIATYRIEKSGAAFDLCIPQPIDAIIACDKWTDNIFYVGDGVGKNGTAKDLPVLLFADRYNFYILPDKKLYTGYDPVDGWKQAFKAFWDYDFSSSIIELKHSNKSYFRRLTFTHHNYQYNDSIPACYKDSCFIFVPTNSPSGRMPISLDSAGKFDFSGIGNTGGIIVQQINYNKAQQSILKPMYVPGVANAPGKKSEDQRRQDRNKRVQTYNNLYPQSMQHAIDYFKIAAETGMYFGSFDALLGLVMNCEIKNYEYILSPSPSAPELLASFYHQYYDDCMNNGVMVNYDALWRLADEFLFDWTLIPRYVWENEYNNNLTSVIQLFGHRYMNSGTDPLTQWLHGGYITYTLTKTNKFLKENNEWNIYIRTITGTYGRDINSVSKANFWTLDLKNRAFVLKLLRNKGKHSEITKFIS